MNAGLKVIFVYFAFTYLTPLVGNWLFADHIVSTFTIYPLNAKAFLTILLVFFLFLALRRFRFAPGFRLSSGFLAKIGAFYLKYRLFFAIACLGIAVAVFGQFNDFRYSDVSLSERNSPILLLAILANVFVQLDLFYQMFLASLVHIRIFSLRWIENMMMVAALFFGVAGTASVMIGLIALLFSLFPTRFKQLVYAGGGGVSTARILKFAALSCAFVVVFFLAWNVGEGIKAASDTGLSIEAVVENMPEIAGNLDLDFAKFFLYTIIERISVHYYSFLMTENLPKNELLHNEPSAFAYPFRSFLFRSNFLFGQAFDVERPDTTTVAQLNYRNLTSLKDFNPREGSAPGLLASFNYAFPFPLNILFCALYLVWVSKVIDVITSANSDKSLSIFGAFLVYLFIDIFFQTPNDFLVVVDNAIFYLAIILGIYFKKKSEPDYVAHALT